MEEVRFVGSGLEQEETTIFGHEEVMVTDEESLAVAVAALFPGLGAVRELDAGEDTVVESVGETVF